MRVSGFVEMVVIASSRFNGREIGVVCADES